MAGVVNVGKKRMLYRCPLLLTCMAARSILRAPFIVSVSVPVVWVAVKSTVDDFRNNWSLLNGYNQSAGS
jgi:hypothetical protein